MTREETKKLLAVIKAAYPAFYKDCSGNDLLVAVGLWNELLADEEYYDAARAVKKIIAVNKFAPSIAEVLEEIGRDKTERLYRRLELQTRRTADGMPGLNTAYDKERERENGQNFGMDKKNGEAPVGF